jgi:peptidoglycan/LPS O-acetylase OafA/YrhL
MHLPGALTLAATLALGAAFLPPDNLRNLLGHAVGGGCSSPTSSPTTTPATSAACPTEASSISSLGVEEQFHLLWPVLI